MPVVINLKEVMAAFNRTENQALEAVQVGITAAAAAVEAQAKENASSHGTRKRVRGPRGGSRLEPRRHVGPSGEGPNVISGNLLNSIRTDTRFGFGRYEAQVGAHMEYARAVEMGLPRWKGGVKYPYLGPAAEKLKQDGSIQRAFVNAFVARLRG